MERQNVVKSRFVSIFNNNNTSYFLERINLSNCLIFVRRTYNMYVKFRSNGQFSGFRMKEYLGYCLVVVEFIDCFELPTTLTI